MREVFNSHARLSWVLAGLAGLVGAAAFTNTAGYFVTFMTGNTERGDNWEAMIGHSDQVVIPVKSVDDAAEGASRVLSALRAGNEHAQSQADRAVVIVLGCTPSHGPAKLNELAESFRPFVKSVVTVPYDPSLIEGRIRFSSMLPPTRRAWLRAAAQIAEGL